MVELTASVPGEKVEVQKCNSLSGLADVDLTETFFYRKGRWGWIWLGGSSFVGIGT